MSLPTQELRELARKYETLASLRRARAAGDDVPAPSVFRALARDFPGCLNELDTLPLEQIDARAAALRATADGGDVEPWMEWLSGYHRLLRAALILKPRLSSRAAVLEDERAERLAEEASRAAGIAVDASFVRAVADPPAGRLVALVLTRLAEQHGKPAADIKRALFPRSRR